MFEGSLAGEDHGHLGLCLVAGLNGLEIPHGAARVDHGADSFFDAHVHAVPEGKERIRDHGRTDEAALGLLRLRVDLFQHRSVFLSRL